MIKLSDINFRYNTDYILQNLNFECKKGDRVGLIGRNGSGKTTLCHIIMGLLTPESGTVEVFGKVRKTESDFREIRGRIGFLFQDADDQLFCPTVLEDIAFGPLNMGKSPEEAKKIVLEVLNRLDLEGFENRITYQLSGGEKRLVSLATVLALQPDFLILDEPTGGLDEDTTERLLQILRDSDLSYLIISHDNEFISQTTNRQMQIRNRVLEPV
jgi:cobalt/nickel transport system ATP-binding protein